MRTCAQWIGVLADEPKINIATGNVSFEAWRERDHDDLMLAVALGLWYAEQFTPPVYLTEVGPTRPSFWLPSGDDECGPDEWDGDGFRHGDAGSGLEVRWRQGA